MAETTSFSSLFDSVDSFIRSGGGDVGALDAKLDDAFAPDVKFHVTGQPGGYQLATDAEGIPAVKDYFLKVMGPAMITAIDFTKPFTNEIVNVIGGHGGEWSAAEMKEMGTGKKDLSTQFCLALSFRIPPQY